MILNTYAVLLAALGVLRLGLSLAALGLAWSARISLARATAPDERDDARRRQHLAFLLVLLLVGLSFLSWPLLYLLLQSYVREWPGVMCIYGVTRIGTGSAGTARLLPGLVDALQLTGPAVALAGGGWVVLHRLNRAAPNDPLLGRLFLALGPLAVLVAFDAAGQFAYVVIPKAEVLPSAGCCMERDDMGRLSPRASLVPRERVRLAWTYYALHGGLIAGLLFAALARRTPGPPALAALAAGGGAGLVVGGVYLTEVAAPTLLRLPNHHCAYDMVSEAPAGVVAVALFLGGTFCLWWAAAAGWLGRAPETAPLLPETLRGLLRLSLAGYAASLAVLGCALIAAS